MLAALTLSLLGVPDADIATDYALSEQAEASDGAEPAYTGASAGHDRCRICPRGHDAVHRRGAMAGLLGSISRQTARLGAEATRPRCGRHRLSDIGRDARAICVD